MVNDALGRDERLLISAHYGFHILYITHTHADFLNSIEKRKTPE